MSIKDRLIKNSTISLTATIDESKMFKKKDMVQTSVPIINVALSGKFGGGASPGLLMIAGPSKHFKSGFSLLMAKAYLDKYKDGIILFYDSEFGTPKEYFGTYDIDLSRVIHTPITNLEEFKFDIMKQLEEIKRGDHVMIVVDSVGNLASKKETDDALDGKSVADMTRAKGFKSLGRLITPHLTLKDIPMIVINHVYSTMCLAGETLIKTTRGNVAIKNVNVGDIVYTNNGTQPVENVWGPKDLSGEGKDFVEIEFDDGTKVCCTHDHKFLSSENHWIEAMNLKLGQNMM